MDRKQQLLWMLAGFVVTALLCGLTGTWVARKASHTAPPTPPDMARLLTEAVSTSQALAPATPTPEPSPVPPTPTAAATATLAFTPTASGETEAAPSPTPEAAATTPTVMAGCLAAVFVEDVTVPDGSAFAPGESFVKTWRLMNRGTCPWTTDFALVFAGGERMDAPERIPLPQEVPPGAIIEISVPMRAPATPGEYRSFWKLRSDSGIEFGVGADASTPIWVFIRVVVTPTPVAPSATPAPTPTP